MKNVECKMKDKFLHFSLLILHCTFRQDASRVVSEEPLFGSKSSTCLALLMILGTIPVLIDAGAFRHPML